MNVTVSEENRGAVLRGNGGPDELPDVLVRQEARLPCGCGVFVGLRLDNEEIVAAAYRCSEKHGLKMDRFYGLFLDSLENPTDRLLIDVVVELLDRADRDTDIVI